MSSRATGRRKTRLSEPEEIANMVVYACSDGASSTTGVSLRVEGGIVTGLG